MPLQVPNHHRGHQRSRVPRVDSLSFILDPSFSDTSPVLKSPAPLVQPASPQQPPLALHPEHSAPKGSGPVSSGDLVPDEGGSGQTSDVDSGALLMSQAAVAVKQQTANLLSGQVCLAVKG